MVSLDMTATTAKLVSAGKRYLIKCNVSDAQFSSEELLRSVLGMKERASLYIENSSIKVTKKQVQNFFVLLRKRGTGYPLHYITKEVGFLDFDLHVEEGVLIPRPETEHVVNEVLQYLQHKGAVAVLDIGTGAGNIAVSIAHYIPESRVLAIDIARKALSVACDNAVRVGVADRIEFRHSDCFSHVEEGRTFDLIVSNPPYVARGAFHALPREVRAEPPVALDGGRDGFLFYRKIIKEARHYLHAGSLLILELGSGQSQTVADLLAENNYKDISVVKDYAHIDRVIRARW